MPGLVDVLRVGSIVYSWTSCIFKVDGQDTKGPLSFDYEQKRERKVVHAARRDGRPIGKTSGKYSVPSMSMKMLKDSADALTTYLTAKGLGSYGDAEFVLSLQCIEPDVAANIGSPPLIILAENCTIDGKKDAQEEGIDELVTEFEIGCLQLTENGKRLWSVLRGLP